MSLLIILEETNKQIIILYSVLKTAKILIVGQMSETRVLYGN